MAAKAAKTAKNRVLQTEGFRADALAARQLEIDRARTKRFPDLFEHKLERMSISPLGFLRGAAPLFYQLLEAHPHLAEGPPGEGWIVGDAHLENFGAYRPDAREDIRSGGPALFDLNDFDETLVAPWRLDVLRLTTSLLLGGRELGADGLVALSLADRLLDAWGKSAFDGEKLPPEPAPVRALIAQVEGRSRKKLLDDRTEVVRKKRRFVRGPRYRDLPDDIRMRVPAALEGYVASLPPAQRPKDDELEIEDVALRVAGTGSLGCLRIAMLLKGKGGRDGGWIFDMKEEAAPSASEFELRPPQKRGEEDLLPALRVATAYASCIARPPRMLGTTLLRYRRHNVSMLVRRLSPQEDKLDLRKLKSADLPSLASYLGGLLGRAHARAATKPPHSRWSSSDIVEIRSRAIVLAGMHEAAYLALCERMRRILPKSAKSKG
ncbi:hypothetical protein AKJ09_05233 [Labilithrix luteola]|uniref:DUF2252 domain-containing protein n=1 Tax=Labilithrix luteola TaxID=1391654 RepID=A0A0K1PZI9_9BACT|nr:DUF2252 family protein [Labilithrix luteola]AKU98569.1 hypothetical protein AKJ09_05233 [Labilithrix luteola]